LAVAVGPRRRGVARASTDARSIAARRPHAKSAEIEVDRDGVELDRALDRRRRYRHESAL